MTEPLVCAVMLTRDRPAMAKRAVRCFREQTYKNKTLLVVNSGPHPLFEEDEQLREPAFEGIDALTIGALRNHANRYASTHYAESWKRPEIFVHLDDDDVSHPNRIAEQVALLQSSGKQVVGYRDCLFWREPNFFIVGDGTPGERSGEAWLYSNNDPRYILGTSLCYWRQVWKAKPFDERPNDRQNNPLGVGEDKTFIRDLDCLGVPSLECPVCEGGRGNILPHCYGCGIKYDPSRRIPVIDTPRMIASVHGGNSSGAYDFEDLLKRGTTNWKRVPEWDAHCREKMSL